MEAMVLRGACLWDSTQLEKGRFSVYCQKYRPCRLFVNCFGQNKLTCVRSLLRTLDFSVETRLQVRPKGKYCGQSTLRISMCFVIGAVCSSKWFNMLEWMEISKSSSPPHLAIRVSLKVKVLKYASCS